MAMHTKIAHLDRVAEYVSDKLGDVLCGAVAIEGTEAVLVFGNYRGERDRLVRNAALTSRHALLTDMAEVSDTDTWSPGTDGTYTGVYVVTPPEWMDADDVLTQCNQAVWCALYRSAVADYSPHTTPRDERHRQGTEFVRAERTTARAKLAGFVLPPLESFGGRMLPGDPPPSTPANAEVGSSSRRHKDTIRGTSAGGARSVGPV